VTIADPAANQVVERARAILDRCQADARTAICNLRAQSASRISVVEAIERVTRKAADDSGASITFRLQGDPPAADAIAEYELPLIAQEAISNALRHGRATHVSVVLTTAPGGGLRLAISDDGVGIKAPKPGGFGITSMRERAARVGGTLEIDSAEGDGTEVCVVVQPDPAAHSQTRSSM
jgi:signal transduction histidine kinase